MEEVCPMARVRKHSMGHFKTKSYLGKDGFLSLLENAVCSPVAEGRAIDTVM